MGKRRYPPLTPQEVTAILGKLGFTFKRKQGSHEQYERPADVDRPRSIVTVDVKLAEFDDYLLKSMIEQSNHSREEFYGATKRTARKASVRLLKQAEADVE
jgi:predicted RNA binding protein YcfA (HicA-like mRNA interferase family)